MTTTSAESKQLIGQYLQALSGQAKTTEIVAKFVSDAALVGHIREIEAAFPAYEMIAEDLIAEGNRVAVRGTFHGVHRGTFAGVAATGRSVSAPFMIVYRIEDRRIVQHWMQFDGPALIAQLAEAATRS